MGYILLADKFGWVPLVSTVFSILSLGYGMEESLCRCGSDMSKGIKINTFLFTTSDCLLRAASCAIFMQSYPDSKNLLYPAIFLFEYLLLCFPFLNKPDDCFSLAIAPPLLFALPGCV